MKSQHPFTGTKEYPDEVDFWLKFGGMVFIVCIFSALAVSFIFQ